jgi:zinc-ribbon domain/Sel1 repeat
VRCPRCGNENLDQNRYCGMCGASLLSPPEPVSVTAPAPSASESAAAPAPAETRRSPAGVSNTPPSISGPSFLGLNDSSAARPVARKRASLSIDPHSGPRSNLDYLLDDEEPPHHWGIGKILLILIALALAVSFGYLRFKNQGVAWLTALKKPTAAVAQNSPSTDSTSTPAPTPSITPEPAPPAQPAATAPPPAASNHPNTPASNPAATPAPEGAAPAASPPMTDAAKPNDTTPAATPDKAAAPTDTSAADKNTTAAKEPAPETPAATTKPVEKPKPALPKTLPKTPAPKPSAATKPAASYDSVAEAQKYLYGRGAPQDCDRGMRLLKPAANQGNAKAMVEMGALYSAGLCTPHDLPTAYRWFALALRKDPESTSIQADLQKLWGEMTPPERQLAIKLTQ